MPGILASLSATARYPLVLAAALTFLPPAVLAQSDESDIGEVAVFGGASAGMGFHPVIGGSSGVAFSRYGMGLVEAVYMPMANDTLIRRDNLIRTETSHLFDFNASFHVRVPVRERWAPYGILGAGFLMNLTESIVTPQGGLVKFTDFKFAFHTGGGVRFYIGDEWGIRPELKIIVSNRTYGRFTIGVFRTLPAGWP